LATPPTLTTADGLRLHLQRWPGPAAARGTVLIVHGLGEHSGRYAHVAAQLNGWGWNVLGYDQRGHGRSQGARARLRRDDDLLTDLALVIATARAEHDGPLVLLGHSMGGLVAARFAAEGTLAQPRPWYRDVDALVLSSPALAADITPGQKRLLAVMSRLAPDVAVHNGLKPEWVSRDPAVVTTYETDPLGHDRISPRLAKFILDQGAWVRERASAWTLPTLLLFAGSDRCVSPAGSEAFAAAAPKLWLTAQRFEPLGHEIFNDPEQAEVFAVLRAWLSTQLPARR